MTRWLDKVYDDLDVSRGERQGAGRAALLLAGIGFVLIVTGLVQ